MSTNLDQLLVVHLEELQDVDDERQNVADEENLEIIKELSCLACGW